MLLILLLFLLLLAVPVGYGWGYRGWGPPYPRYYSRRRGEVAGGPAAEEAAGWGVLADVLWAIALVFLIWWFLAVVF